MSNTDILNKIESILEAEKSALLSGNLDKIAEMSDQKERLFSELKNADSEQLVALEALQQRYAHNQELMDGALQGIRNVAKRLAEIRRLGAGLDTYDADGRKTVIPGLVEHRMEKRA